MIGAPAVGGADEVAGGAGPAAVAVAVTDSLPAVSVSSMVPVAVPETTVVDSPQARIPGVPATPGTPAVPMSRRSLVSPALAPSGEKFDQPLLPGTPGTPGTPG